MSNQIHPVYQRMAEIYSVWRRNNFKLSSNLTTELMQCLEVNYNMVWEQAKIINTSLIAHEINDVEWQHEICAKIDKGESEC